MKYADVKDKIDEFFKNISSEELYDLAIESGFKQVPQRKKGCFQLFKESLEKMTEEEFEAHLDEMQEEAEKYGNDGITIGEFLSKFITNHDDLEDYENYEDEKE